MIALRDSVLKTANATTTAKWLHRSTSGRLLMSMARGETAVSYAVLDQHAGRGIDHLRGLLISTGGLEPEVRWIDELAHELTNIVSTIDDRADRKVITGWLRWQALPRLRRRVERGASTTHSAANVRRQAQQILLFVAGIEQRTRTLATCTQSDIDMWFAQPGKTRAHIRPFLAWTAKHKHTPTSLVLPSATIMGMPVAVDSGHRWQMARMLVTDDTVATRDRVAGALLVLYAQTLTRIAALTTDDVHRSGEGTVTITVAERVVIELVEPFDALILELPVRRRAGISDQLPTKWLFPGSTPNQHADPAAIATRLRLLGIEPRKMRAAAVAQLAAEIPPAILAGTIGIAPGTAAKWAAIVAGDWTRYAAQSIKRVPESAGSRRQR